MARRVEWGEEGKGRRVAPGPCARRGDLGAHFGLGVEGGWHMSFLRSLRIFSCDVPTTKMSHLRCWSGIGSRMANYLEHGVGIWTHVWVWTVKRNEFRAPIGIPRGRQYVYGFPTESFRLSSTSFV